MAFEPLEVPVMSGRYEKFPIMPLRITIRARDEIELPPYTGSTLRGAFGVALKRICCIARRSLCDQCSVRNSCIYVYFFETPLLEQGPEGSRFRNAPHPFVFRIPLMSEALILRPLEEWSFGITLFGKSVVWLPYVVAAVQKMGEIGIGRGRGSFELAGIELLDADENPVEHIYCEDRLVFPKKFLYLHELGGNSGKEGLGRFYLDFLTPLRLRFKGRLVDVPEFHILMGNLFQRLSVLMKVHGEGEEVSSFHEVIDLARNIRLVSNETRWHDWERYSHRQRQRMRLGGIVGRAVYEGNPSVFEPFLTVGTLIHIGKNTGFGLGRYRWSQDS